VSDYETNSTISDQLDDQREVRPIPSSAPSPDHGQLPHYRRTRTAVYASINHSHSTHIQTKRLGSSGLPRGTPSCRSVHSRLSSGRLVSLGPGHCSTITNLHVRSSISRNISNTAGHTKTKQMQEESDDPDLTMTPGLRSKFLLTICSSSFSLIWEEPYVNREMDRGWATPIAYAT